MQKSETIFDCNLFKKYDAALKPYGITFIEGMTKRLELLAEHRKLSRIMNRAFEENGLSHKEAILLFHTMTEITISQFRETTAEQEVDKA